MNCLVFGSESNGILAINREAKKMLSMKFSCQGKESRTYRERRVGGKRRGSGHPVISGSMKRGTLLEDDNKRNFLLSE